MASTAADSVAARSWRPAVAATVLTAAVASCGSTVAEEPSPAFAVAIPAPHGRGIGRNDGARRWLRRLRRSERAVATLAAADESTESGSISAAVAAALLCGAAATGTRTGARGSNSLRWRARPQAVKSSLTRHAKKESEDSGVSYKDTVLLPQTDFPQRGNAKVREPEIQEFWKNEKIYEKMMERDNPKGAFTLHDGPPYANGSLHMGHALNKILKDIINKTKASQGYKVKFIPGWDCHGLPIELKVLQSLKSKERKGLTPLKLREIAGKFARETVAEQRKSFERYGVFGDFDDPYLTLLPEYEAAQLKCFEEMVRGGHIYRGRKPVYWSPSTRTALAESELEYPDDHVSQSIYVAFQCMGEVPEALAEAVSDTSDLEVAVWTTTPWTIPANRAVAVNPELEYVVAKAVWEDGRTKKLIVAQGLVESLKETLEAESMTVEATFLGQALEGLKYAHPLVGTESPVVIGGDYITTESGTGLVHTAPGHGQDDYAVGLKYGLEVAAPVNNAGNFTEEVGVESLVGANVLKDANDKVIDLLKEGDRLLLQKPYKHKYPYDWRSKKPVITRATPQWFASIEGLRPDCLKAMGEVEFIPPNYANRMRPMIEGRSDWCISRQRSWGVPIPCFFHKETEEALLTADVISHVRKIVEEKGTSAWFELDVVDLLPEDLKAEAENYEKGTDTMDVWFDSGSSWAYVEDKLDKKKGEPVDLYLEGQDQHRGWFQSSLITSVACRGKAPYKAVMTHGFCVDGNGRKMSKSIGNVIDPYIIINGGGNTKKEPAYGADTLRLWAASVDYTTDVPISQDIMASVGQKVAQIRNRVRFMLGNINDFDHTKDCVAYSELPLIDRYVIREAEQAFALATEQFGTYAFSKAMKAVFDFMQELSAFYLDVAKDRLYIEAKDSTTRRSSQTVIRWLVEMLARVVSPVLSHTAEDIWRNMPGEKSDTISVFLAGWWTPFPGDRPEEESKLLDDFKAVVGLRKPLAISLEKARKAKLVGDALEAKIEIGLSLDAPVRASIDSLSRSPVPEVDNLKTILGVSAVDVVDKAADAEQDVAMEVSKSAGNKCERCWIYEDSVGSNEAHPCICTRCAAVMESLEA